MRMKPETYETILEETRAVIAKIEETGARLHPDREFDPDNITMRDMWDINLVANMDRSHRYHPRHDVPGLLPRCLEFSDRSHYWLWDRDGENLDDSHVETAFRKIIATIKEERLEASTTASTRSLTPSF